MQTTIEIDTYVADTLNTITVNVSYVYYEAKSGGETLRPEPARVEIEEVFRYSLERGTVRVDFLSDDQIEALESKILEGL